MTQQKYTADIKTYLCALILPQLIFVEVKYAT